MRNLSASTGLLLLTLFTASAITRNAAAVELERVELNYRRFVETNYVLEVPGFEVKEAIDLDLDVDLMGPIYWRNTIRSLTDDGAYRFVSWNFMLGAQILESLSVEFEHKSGHLLDHPDYDYPDGHFPVEDSINVRWVIHDGSRAPALFH